MPASFFSAVRFAQPQRGAALTGAKETKSTLLPSDQMKPPSSARSSKPIQQPKLLSEASLAAWCVAAQAAAAWACSAPEWIEASVW